MPTRRTALLMLAAGAAVATRARAAKPAQDVLRAADVHVAGYPTVEAVRWIGERLSAATGGELGIHVYHSGQLGREQDTVEMARFGAIDLTRVNFAPLTNPFPLTGVAALPYAFQSVVHMRRAMDGEPGRRILDDFARRDLIGLAIYDSGVRCVYNVRHAIQAPRDLKGMKIRVPPSDIFIEIVRALGANPTPLSFGEVYSSLQTHLIEGAENNIRSFHSSRQFEVARYWSETRHSYSPEALLMSRRSFDRLGADQQALLLRLATESVPVMRVAWDEAERTSRAAVLAAGVQINDVQLQEFARATRAVVEARLAAAPLRRLYEDIQVLA